MTHSIPMNVDNENALSPISQLVNAMNMNSTDFVTGMTSDNARHACSRHSTREAALVTLRSKTVIKQHRATHVDEKWHRKLINACLAGSVCCYSSTHFRSPDEEQHSVVSLPPNSIVARRSLVSVPTTANFHQRRRTAPNQSNQENRQSAHRSFRQFTFFALPTCTGCLNTTIHRNGHIH
jgi:hypothetical protein